jgi:phosphoglycolate phosphatase
MRTEQIYIDMDGTIVQYHDRFYIVYSIACCRVGMKPLGREKWLECRRLGIPTYTSEEHKRLDPIFEELFESPEYLCFDRLMHGMDNVVKILQYKYDVHIVSFRAKDQNLKDQLGGYGITNINTIIKGFSPNTVVDEKANMIQRVISNPKGWIIGDTPYEVTAGQRLGLKTIAVTWGDKNRESLEKYNPDYIVDSPSEILDIIE